MKNILLFDKEQYIKNITGIDLKSYKFDNDVYKYASNVIYDILNKHAIFKGGFLNAFKVALTEITHCYWDYDEDTDPLTKNLAIMMKSDAGTGFTMHFDNGVISFNSMFDNKYIDAYSKDIRLVFNKVICDYLSKDKNIIVKQFLHEMDKYAKKIEKSKSNSQDKLMRVMRLKENLEKKPSFNVPDYELKDINRGNVEIDYMGRKIKVDENSINNSIYTNNMHPFHYSDHQYIYSLISDFEYSLKRFKVFPYNRNNNKYPIYCWAHFNDMLLEKSTADEKTCIEAHVDMDIPNEIIKLTDAYEKYIKPLKFCFDPDGIITLKTYHRESYDPENCYDKKHRNLYDHNKINYNPYTLTRMPSFTLKVDNNGEDVINSLSNQISRIKGLIDKAKNVKLSVPKSSDTKIIEALKNTFENDYVSKYDDVNINFNDNTGIVIQTSNISTIENSLFGWCFNLERLLKNLTKLLDMYKNYLNDVFECGYRVDKVAELWDMYSKRILLKYKYDKLSELQESNEKNIKYCDQVIEKLNSVIPTGFNVDGPVIKPENKISAKPGDKTTFLNEGVGYSDLCQAYDYYPNRTVNVKKESKNPKIIK